MSGRRSKKGDRQSWIAKDPPLPDPVDAEDYDRRLTEVYDLFSRFLVALELYGVRSSDGRLEITSDESAEQLSSMHSLLSNQVAIEIMTEVLQGRGTDAGAEACTPPGPLYIACRLISNALNSPVRDADTFSRSDDVSEPRYVKKDAISPGAWRELLRAHAILEAHASTRALDDLNNGRVGIAWHGPAQPPRGRKQASGAGSGERRSPERKNARMDQPRVFRGPLEHGWIYLTDFCKKHEMNPKTVHYHKGKLPAVAIRKDPESHQIAVLESSLLERVSRKGRPARRSKI